MQIRRFGDDFNSPACNYCGSDDSTTGKSMELRYISKTVGRAYEFGVCVRKYGLGRMLSFYIFWNMVDIGVI